MSTPYVQHEDWARLVFGISVGAFALGELSQAVKRRRGSTRADWRSEAVFRIGFFAGVLLLPLAQTLTPGAVLGGPTAFVAGLIIGWCGLLLRWWSFATLGKYFTTVITTSADQQVVSRGPYRVLRHPSYTGLLSACVGCGLVVGNWVGMCASALLILRAIVYRLQREEQAMCDALGDAYRQFASGRARLVPYLW